MLNSLAFSVLADPDKVPTQALRLFLRIAVDYDLTVPRVLNAHALVQQYGLTRHEASKCVSQLCAIGILEMGPLVRVTKMRRLNTYRIAPGYLLSAEDLQTFFRETRERAERESLMAPADSRKMAPVVV